MTRVCSRARETPIRLSPTSLQYGKPSLMPVPTQCNVYRTPRVCLFIQKYLQYTTKTGFCAGHARTSIAVLIMSVVNGPFFEVREGRGGVYG